MKKFFVDEDCPVPDSIQESPYKPEWAKFVVAIPLEGSGEGNCTVWFFEEDVYGNEFSLEKMQTLRFHHEPTIVLPPENAGQVWTL